MTTMSNIHWANRESVAPTFEPVTVDEMASYMNVDHNADDTFFSSTIEAAREQISSTNGHQLAQATFIMTLDRFPCFIEVPRAPLNSVTTLKYFDNDGVQQTWDSANYTVDTESTPGRITRAFNISWPDVRLIPNAIEVTYVAGYTTAANCPEKFKTALKMLVAHWYEIREPGVTGTIYTKVPHGLESILMSDKVRLTT